MHRFLGFRLPLGLAATAMLAVSAPVVALPITNSSPIDIRPENTRFDPDLPALQFDYSAAANLRLVNTGSPDEEATVRAEFASGAGSLTLGTTRFDLLQFHFHTEGEHAVNGVRPAMELHQVHRSADGTLAVVARLIEEGPQNALLAPLFDGLPATAGELVEIDAFNLAGLVPTDLRSYRYSGSLTTPPFTGAVLWNVLADPLFLSAGQIASFRLLFPEGNSRGLQPFTALVRTDVAGFATNVPEPAAWAMMIVGFGLAGAAARQRQPRASSRPSEHKLR